MSSAPQEEQTAWTAFARATAREFRDQLGVGRFLRLTPKQRDRLARRLRSAIDNAMEVPPDLPAQIAREVRILRAQAGEDADPVRLAWSRTRERARRTAAVGAVTTIPALVPGIGTALAALGLIADWRYVADQQRDLALEIATIFGVPLDDPTQQVRALFMASAGSAFAAKEVGQATARAVAAQVARRSVTKLIPGIGAVVAGAINYAATVAIGRAAIARFGRQAGLEVRGWIPSRVSPELPRLRQQVVGALELAELGQETGPVLPPESHEAIRRLSLPEREELLDLAVMTALAEQGITPTEERILGEIAQWLEFTPADLAEALEAGREEILSADSRFRALIAATGQRGRRAASGAWNLSRAVARQGWRRARLLRPIRRSNGDADSAPSGDSSTAEVTPDGEPAGENSQG